MGNYLAPIWTSNPIVRPHALNRGRVGWWLTLPPLDGGRQWYDIAGAGAHGILTNFTSTGGWRNSTRPGGNGHVLFDPTHLNFVDVPPTPALAIAGDITLASSFRTVSANPQVMIGGYQSVAPYYGYGLGVGVAGGAGIPSLWTASPFAWNAGGSTSYADGLWHRLLVSISSADGLAHFYVDGKLIASPSVGTPSFYLGDRALGSTYGGGNYCDGSLDDLSIWSRALSSSEAWAEYQEGLRGYPETLRRVWTAKPSFNIGSTAYTSTQAGDWSLISTWGGLGIPGVGDTATIHHDVTVTNDTTIGNGSNTTVLTIGDGTGNGTLTITGVKFTIRGNGLSNHGADSLPQVQLLIQSTTGHPAGVELDGNAGVSPVLTMGTCSQITIIGTASDRCYFRTKAGTAGNPGQVAYNFGYLTLGTDAVYCDFARLGDASTVGWGIVSLDDPACVAHFDHCTFDTCGIAPKIQFNVGDASSHVTHCVWTNPQATNNFSLTSSVNRTTGTRLFQYNVTSSSLTSYAVFDLARGWTIEDNVFLNGLFAAAETSPLWTSFARNFVAKPSVQEDQYGGDVTDCYIYSYNSNTVLILSAQYADSTIQGVIFESLTDIVGSAVSGTEGGTTDHTITVKDCLVLPGTGSLMGMNSNTSIAHTDFYVCEHNTICFSPGHVGVNAGVTVGQKANTVTSFKSNLFYSTGTAIAGTYAFQNDDPAPSVCLPAADADYNGWYRLSTVPAGTWSDIADGTVYSSPMTGATPPGVHDVPATNPLFVDSTRNLAGWDASLGGPGTTAHAIAKLALQYDPSAVGYNASYTTSALLTWVRDGFAPQNAALHNTAHDGTDIGAITYVSPTQTITGIGVHSTVIGSPTLLARSSITASGVHSTVLGNPTLLGRSSITGIGVHSTVLGNPTLLGRSSITGIGVHSTVIGSPTLLGRTSTTGIGVHSTLVGTPSLAAQGSITASGVHSTVVGTPQVDLGVAIQTITGIGVHTTVVAIPLIRTSASITGIGVHTTHLGIPRVSTGTGTVARKLIGTIVQLINTVESSQSTIRPI